MIDSGDRRPSLPPAASEADGAEGLDDPRVTRALEDYLAALEAGRPPDRDEFLARHAEIAPALAGCLPGLELVAPVPLRRGEPVADDCPPLDESAGALESLVGRVADEFTDRLRRGERPDVEEYARRHPWAAVLLREVLQPLQALAPSGLGAVGPGAAPVSPDPLPDVLGDFRIVREVGRGGMGIVYEAVQISLGRPVALKVLPLAAALDARQLQRFKNEAQAAAHLHHHSIVPVYYVGCERGVHFYVMQFIEGRTLAEVIRGWRSASASGGLHSSSPRPSSSAADPGASALCSPDTAPWPDTLPSAGLATQRSTRLPEFFRTIARLGLQAAEALEHAHQEGIVHRDIKPANLLVDNKGTLWITDFGLARLQHETGLTVSGDLIGTLRYMSPEQALGYPAAVDHRTDVYALGATLYELLTLCPVFEGRDRQELLRRIASEEPRLSRRLNPAVPAELEIIVQKALEKEPRTRYATAQALADDLRRFLEDKPIRARRPSWPEQARKWARRHRPVVWSAGAALLVTLAVLAGSVGWVVRDRAARQARIVADLQVVLAEAQRARREGKWPQAQAAAKRAEALLNDGAADQALAQRVRDLLRELAEEEADGQLVARLEELRLLQADVKENRFVLERALPDYRQAFHSYGLRADALTPAEAAALLLRRPLAVRATLVAALDHWLILARHEKAPEADWLEQVLSAADSDAWRQRVRAARERGDRQALEDLAREVKAAAQPPEALFLLNLSLRQRGANESAVLLLQRAQEAFPGDFWINHDLGMALQACRPPQLEEAIRFLTAATALRPASPGVRLNLGIVLWNKGRLGEAAAAFRKALDLQPDYAMAHEKLSGLLIEKGPPDEAIAACRRAIAFHPEDAGTHYNLGTALAKYRRPDEAVAAFRKALDLKPAYAEAHCSLGLVLSRQGNFAPALAALKQGHELGSRRPDWLYPSATWVEKCQRLVELDGQLPAVLKAEAQPADAAEWSEYAHVCYYKKLYVASARLRTSAFTADPKLADDVEGSHRYDAACAAALAAAGQGADAGPLDAQERTGWRKQALEWLRADLGVIRKRLETGKPLDRVLLQQRLRHWQRDPDLASLRDPDAVARLPADEQEACKQLWAEVEASLAKVGPAG
jgi:serine/threonine protein kinase/Flp pilus assembly protein TadD